MSFTFSTVANIRVGCGLASQLPTFASELCGKRVLLISDPGLQQCGLLAPVEQAFADSQCELDVFTEVCADPTETVVLAAVDRAIALDADLIIGFGGGSSLDVAKLVAVLSSPSCQQRLSAIYGVDQVAGPRLPLLLVPTTAGTGSEVTPVAIVTTGDTTKAGVVSSHLLPDMAVLDASLTVGLPPAVTAATGIDAMVHAIEAYTSIHRKNPLSDNLAREALRLLASNLPQAVAQGDDLAAREACLLGAMLAGQAFANAPVAAVHALAYPLGGHFHIPHGLSNALVLPEVLRFNLPKAAHWYAELAPLLCEVRPGSDASSAAEQMIDALQALIARVGLPARLRELDIPQSSLPQLAEDAMLQQRLLINNPREVSYEDALGVYQRAY